jgi:lipoprotein-releasing system ATP-binding protein
MNKNILELNHITHGYGAGITQVNVLRDLSFSLESGCICALVGPSGSGKSTLLQIAGLLESPNSGQILIDGTDPKDFNDNQKSHFRGEKIGFVYQFHRLLPEMTALENVLLPQLFMGVSHDAALKRATDLMEKTGVGHRKNHLPSEMSGGEQQRTAIARALSNKPVLLLADEPTGNLDPTMADKIFHEMTEFVRSQGAAALIATHNMELALAADKQFSPFSQ